MPEILTESFCERCGTRYTFEAAAPKGKRLGKLKVLSKGLANFVTNDDSSFDEAFADARSDEQRELTNQQLDAFHQTFQFCLSCRQYTCANCWNEAESRCLSCAPNLGTDALGVAFPNLDPLAGIGFGSAARTDATNGNGHAIDGHPVMDAWPTADLPALSDGAEAERIREEEAQRVRQAEADAAAAAAALIAAEHARQAAEAEAERVRLAEIEAEAERRRQAAAAEVERVRLAEEAAEAEQARIVAEAESERIRQVEIEAEAERQRQAAAQAAAAEAERRRQAEIVAEAERQRQVAEAAAAAEAERQRQAAEAEAERVRQAEVAAEAERARQAAAAEAAEKARLAALAAADAERARQTAEAEAERHRRAAAEAAATAAALAASASGAAPRAVPDPAPAVEPLGATRPAPETGPLPAAAAADGRRSDGIETPTWQIVAPDPTTGATVRSAGSNGATVNGSSPVASGAPQWPTPGAITASADMWAASSQDVLDRTGVAGVQACTSCGLPLSASARFCRRCGTQQH